MTVSHSPQTAAMGRFRLVTTGSYWPMSALRDGQTSANSCRWRQAEVDPKWTGLLPVSSSRSNQESLVARRHPTVLDVVTAAFAGRCDRQSVNPSVDLI